MNTKDLIQMAQNTLLKVTNRPDIVMERGKGMVLYDVEGNEYLDFVGGWAVNCLGHSPEILVDALADQSKKLVNASPSFFNLPMIAYADLLIKNCCFDRVFFASTGAEANEGAIKLARKYGGMFKGGAFEIITTRLGFHGRTLATMSATGKKHWDLLFEPKVTGFFKSEFNNIQSVKDLVTDNTCAVMIEPIQGEGGINVANPDYIKALRKLCNENKMLLIFDEIQTGMGRTGKLFCYEHYGIEPDIMTIGKGIGGGFPLSALLAKEELNIFDPGDQGGTYTGQPLAMAVGLAVLKELLNKNLIEHCHAMGKRIFKDLSNLQKEYAIENIRGKGLLVGFDLQKDKAGDVVLKCLEQGLLINSPVENAIRLMPPLIVSEREIDAMVDILKRNISRK